MQSLTPSINTLERVAKEFLPKLPGKLPMPRFEIKSDFHSPWLGRCDWTPGEPNTTIEIQKSIFADSDTLRRTVAHELCHHCDYLTNKLSEFEKDPKSFDLHERYHDGHGPSFHKIAAVLNSVFGRSFVVDKGDMAMNVDHVPEYLVLLMRDKGHRIYWSVSHHPTEEQKKHISDVMSQKFDHREYKLTRSTDPLLAKGSPIGDSFSTPKPGKDPINHTLVDRLVELWKHGASVPPPHMAHASSDDTLFVPRTRTQAFFSNGQVFYIQSSYTPEFIAVANMDRFNLIALPLSKKDPNIAKPIMEARAAARLPKNLRLTFPGQLHGVIELRFDVIDSHISFVLFVKHDGEIGIDIMEGSNRRNLALFDRGRSLWDKASTITTMFTDVFSTVRSTMIAAMQDNELKIDI